MRCRFSKLRRSRSSSSFLASTRACLSASRPPSDLWTHKQHEGRCLKHMNVLQTSRSSCSTNELQQEGQGAQGLGEHCRQPPERQAAYMQLPPLAQVPSLCCDAWQALTESQPQPEKSDQNLSPSHDCQQCPTMLSPARMLPPAKSAAKVQKNAQVVVS